MRCPQRFLLALIRGKNLNRSLNKVPISQKYLEENASFLKDKVVSTSDQYFNRAKKQVAFFYPDPELNQKDLLKVVREGQLVDGE